MAPAPPPGLGPDRFELVPSTRARRGLATINVAPEDKGVFDAVQWWLQHRMGRSASQWDVFSFLLAEALANDRSPLRDADLFSRR